MARYVIIADPAQKYIRLHQVCRKGASAPCEKTVVYYCPNFCYQSHVIDASNAALAK
jgi:hypothetical protein